MEPKIDALQRIIAEQAAKIALLEQQLADNGHSNAIFCSKILSELPEHIYYLDKNGCILACNIQQAKFFGFSSPYEVIGKNLYDLAQELQWDQALVKQVRDNDTQVLQSGQEVVIEETLIIDGQRKIFLSYKKPLLGDSGEIIGIVGVSIDISSRKQLEEKLRLAELRANNEKIKFDTYIENILANVPEHLYWMDKNEVILGCNDRQAWSFGLPSKTEVVGKSIDDLAEIVGWDKPMLEAIHRNNQEIMATGRGRIIEEHAIFHGEHRTFLSYKNPLLDRHQQVIGIFGITVDITERKRLEQEIIQAKEKAEQATLAKSEFVMNMSHDLRTPLNGVLGLAQILQIHESDMAKKESLGNILTSARQLLKLLNEIIDITYLEQGMPIKQQVFNIMDVANDVVALLASEAAQKGLALTIVASDSIPILIGDQMRTNRIVLNLLSNAVKFTARGGVKLAIAIVKQETDNVLLEIKVNDSGLGIPPDKLDLIFERFMRLTSSYQGVYQGSGLGLYIVTRFVKELHGEIKVKSKLGQGSTFTCLLPFKRA
jgi:two-component system aerobic respiration control sensor histidine kinase ArcB